MSFGKHCLVAVLTPQLLAVRRLAHFEGGRSNVGALFYERGPKPGWKVVTDFVQQLIDAGKLRSCNAAIATAHLRELYAAELLELCLLGLPADTSARNIAKVVQRAADVFLAAYGPTEGTDAAQAGAWTLTHRGRRQANRHGVARWTVQPTHSVGEIRRLQRLTWVSACSGANRRDE
ncbi:hypothetical protein OKW46_001567 [Paraburkholderia sp. WSM4179]|nr:hypothetical protein [Paraburkholderia sp. WSM4179]